MSMSMSSQQINSNDPRQPSSAKPYNASLAQPQEPHVDYYGFFAVFCGLLGAMLRYKLGSWLAIIFCAQSLVNVKNVETDLKQFSMAMMFALMGLITNYTGPRPSAQS